MESTGTYLEITTFDGIKESNSRFFDMWLRWDGLLIEPKPSDYPSLFGNNNSGHRMSFSPSCSIEEEPLNKTVYFNPYLCTNTAMNGKFNAYKGEIRMSVPSGLPHFFYTHLIAE
jgi:hypothetical protein